MRAIAANIQATMGDVLKLTPEPARRVRSGAPATRIAVRAISVGAFAQARREPDGSSATVRKRCGEPGRAPKLLPVRPANVTRSSTGSLVHSLRVRRDP